MTKLIKMPKDKDFRFKPTKSKSKGESTIKVKGDDWNEYITKRVKAAARKKYKVVEIKHTTVEGGNEDTIFITVRNMTIEERAAEDQLRVSEKEAAELRKAEKATKAADNGDSGEPMEDSEEAE